MNSPSRTHLLKGLYRLIGVTISCASACGGNALAATATWDGGGVDTNWMTPANWVSDTVPSALDSLVFGGTQGLFNTNDFVGGTAFGDITFDASATEAFFLGGNSIVLNGGIQVVRPAPNLTVTHEIALNIELTVGDHSFSSNSAPSAGIPLLISGVISGAGGIVKTGQPGGLELVGQNTYTGRTVVNGNNVHLDIHDLKNGGEASSIGASSSDAANLVLGTVNAGARLVYSGGETSTDRLFTMGRSAVIASSGSGALTWSNTGAIAFTSLTDNPRTLTLGGTNTDENIFAPLINDVAAGVTMSLRKEDAGTWNVTNTNTFTGITTLAGGTLKVSSLANGGVASGIGASSNAPGNVVFSSAGLVYTGAGANTDRLFTIYSSSNTLNKISSSGTGILNFTNPGSVAFGGTVGPRSLVLGGTNTGDNTFAPVLSNYGADLNITSFRKRDTGTWVLTGAHTYTGITNVEAGTLKIAPTGSISPSSNVNVFAGAKFFYNNSTTPLNSTISLNNGADPAIRATLGGTGTIGTSLLLDNVTDTLSPGDNSISILTFNSAQSWDSFSYDWEVNSSSGESDRIGINGDLTLLGNVYQLIVLSLGSESFEAGESWTILTTSGGISGFNASNWTLDLTGVSADPDKFSLNQIGNDLVLQYAIPEPSDLGLLAAGGLLMMFVLRRRTSRG